MARWPARCAVPRASSRNSTRLIGCRHADGGADCYFVLTRPVFGEERFRRHARSSQGCHEAGAEVTLFAEGSQRIGTLWFCRDSGVNKLLFEARQNLTTGDLLETVEGAAQKMARAVRPGFSLRGADVGKTETFGNAAFDRDADFGGGVGQQNNVPNGSERRGADQAKHGDADVGRGIADAFVQFLGEVGGGDGLAAYLCREIADADEDQFFRQERGCGRLHRVGSTARISATASRANAGRLASRQPPRTSHTSRTTGQRFAGQAGIG